MQAACKRPTGAIQASQCKRADRGWRPEEPPRRDLGPKVWGGSDETLESAPAMGFLNLSAWRPVGGRRVAERRARTGFAQPPRFYYEHLREFQSVVDRFFEENGRRPTDVAELYLWLLEQEGKLEDDERARELSMTFSFYDIEPNSLLGLVAIRPDHPKVAADLYQARQFRREQGHRPPQAIPFEAGLA
jgi:hypothetical protein